MQTSFEPIESRGYSQLVKVNRQGRWFMLKGLKPEFRQSPIYLELLKKEFNLMVQLDHPNIVKAFAKEMNDEIGPCIVMEYIDGMTLDKFLESKPSRQLRRKVVEQLIDALTYIHSKQILHRYRYCHITSKCTRKNPDERYADMESVRKALERCDRRRKMIPPFIILLLIALCVLFVAKQPSLMKW